jgi:hypothetical protein
MNQVNQIAKAEMPRCLEIVTKKNNILYNLASIPGVDYPIEEDEQKE